MGRSGQAGGEGTSDDTYNEQFEPYHDDPDGYDANADTIESGALLQDSQRVPAEHYNLARPIRSKWRERFEARIPPRMRSAWMATQEWTEGPKPPRIYTISPHLSKVQYAPVMLLERYAPKGVQKFWLLVLLYALWLLWFSLVLWKSSFSTYIPEFGTPYRLSCSSRYWSKGNQCGINGDECRPFAHAHLAFRCPASCSEQQVFIPHPVGDKAVVYQSLVIGGPANNETGYEDKIVDNAVYRGDSFICSSAVHAGFIDDNEGGCGVLTLTGEQSSFSASNKNRISSVGFDSYFPQSFGFLEGTHAQCKDMRWPALVVTVIFTTILGIFTTSPGVFFWSIFAMMFFTVALATDPPNLLDYHRLLSVAFERFLPACFCAWVTYRYTVVRSLTNLTAQIEKTVLWLGPAWVGALNNYTFDKLPIQRLTPHDLRAQPGAIPTLIIVVLSIFAIALGQAWAFRVEGRMPRYLVIYGLFVVSLLLFVTMPGFNVRIHHYILALLLLPGTSFQNRPSLVYQGLLVGMFINGIARWGFASIIELPSELLAGVAKGTLLPDISVLAIGASNITFDLGPLPVVNPKSGRTFDGISVLVNDVERFRGYGDNEDYWPDDWVRGSNFTWMWKRHKLGSDMGLNDDDDHNDIADTIVLPEYFRFAYMAGSSVADYTKAGKWDSGGNWTQMDSGPS